MDMFRSMLAGTAILLAACAPTQFLKKSYAPADLDGKGVLVYPVFPGQVRITNMPDFEDDFEDVEGDPQAYLAMEMNNAAGRAFREQFKRVVVENMEDSAFRPLDAGNSLKVTEKIGKDEFEIRIPKAEELRARNASPRFILVMDRIVFSRNLEAYQHSMPAAPMPAGAGGNPAAPTMVTRTKNAMAVGMNYAIYDYEAGEVVGYGYATGEEEFRFAMTREDWYDAMEKAFKKVKDHSPFK
jgi:hypothetical protein